MTMVTLAAGLRQMPLGYYSDVMRQDHHIQATTDITMITVTLAA